MKIFLLLSLVWLVSCNSEDVDGILKVLRNFELIDEDGRRVDIATGAHRAELSYKWSDGDIELEIDKIDGGKDRDFDFKAPTVGDSDVTTSKKEERVRMSLLSAATGQPISAEVVIHSKIISRDAPEVFWDRCNAYYGAENGIVGHLRLRTEDYDHDANRPRGGVFSHIYTVSSVVKSQLSVTVMFHDGEDMVAMFEGKEKIEYRDLLWEGECDSEYRPVILDNP